MRRAIALGVMAVLLSAPAVSGAEINVKVVTDCSTYSLGGTVHWTILAWASVGDNRGVSVLGMDLTDSRGEQFHSALTTGGGDLLNSDYSPSNGFLQTSGDNSAAGDLVDIAVYQLTDPSKRVLDIGNDGSEHVFAEGIFIVTQPGLHTLGLTLVSADYWPDGTQAAVPFSPGSNTSAGFVVTVPEPASLSLIGIALFGVARVFRRQRT